MVKFTSFVKYNDKFEQNHAFERISNENNYEISNFNEVNENYGQKWNLQQILKNNWKYTI